ncbi:hypothetical protein AEQ67_04460 [Pseudomonas sp. RIT-PI-q]|nr:hypothetical protein AEQ67_04460 [Pseudomonas sp. RIT-PI-q]
MRDNFDQPILLDGTTQKRTGSLNIDVVARQRGPGRQPDREPIVRRGSLIDEVIDIDSNTDINNNDI